MVMHSTMGQIAIYDANAGPVGALSKKYWNGSEDCIFIILQ